MNREQVAPLLPHGGAMLLIDGVTAFDRDGVACVSVRHRDPANPLRREGQLAGLHAVEFAAQAAAVHGGLSSRDGPAPLRALAAVRDARIDRARLDDLPGFLTVEARIVLLDARAVIYQARLSHEGEEIAAMRLTLMTLGPAAAA